MSEHGYGPAAGRGPAGGGSTGNPPWSPEPSASATTPQAGPGEHTAPTPGQHVGWAAPQAPTTPYHPGYGGHPAAAEPLGGPPSSPVAPRRAGRVRIGLAGLVAGALIGGGAGAGVVTLLDEPTVVSGSGAAAQSVTIENPEMATTATAAAAKAAPSVVTIYVSSGSNSGSGSGVVLTDDGYVLTNDHVVAEAANGGSVQVRTADGTLYDASVVGTDPASDLAVLRLDGASGLTPATFADSDEVQVGDVAVAIGAPLGLSNTVTDGIISATGRAVATGGTQDEATVIDALQTDAAINPGNSGGALVNGAGEVIGINTAIATVASGIPGGSSQSGNIGVGFAIPSNHAQRIAREIIETGSATRTFLGVSAGTASDRPNSRVGTGAEVASVQPDSAAEDAGIREGDVITAVDDRPVTSSTELTAAIRSKAPGDEVTLTVRRGSETTTVEVTLGSVD
ncbi:trypsin-like peptidase domain-containing protein [Blastococcus sp. PRF04-17]|uniref:trypsin-like peptidase domain-containing protein n=1 Tax=Blastococcus sp. PRF04-17 TaxID=2933797 RepID=UPI001FF3D6F5|nr:trypsin-like peptidase domain-containing protein [Blastococcus sp. PRF04-17]UOX99889.1 trypsin-like peptidase domain-containing protein [Blastococcus sp. PRF04-17]